MAEWRVLVAASRTWRQPVVVRSALEAAWLKGRTRPGRPPWMTVVHSGARGAEQEAGAYATERGWNVEVHYADWARPCDRYCEPDHRRMSAGGAYCPDAADLRNQAQIRAGADVVLVFSRDHSDDVEDLLRRAEKAGLDVDLHRDCDCHPAVQSAPERIPR